MPFDQSSISNVSIYVVGAEVFISWSSTADDDTVFQVYQDGQLVWSGTDRQVFLPFPITEASYEIGTIDDEELGTNLSDDLPDTPRKKRALLTWEGGTFLDETISHFLIYGEPTAGAGVDYDNPIGNVPAYPGGEIIDGWGTGRWGTGGWGADASDYSWISQPLSGGTWTFGVVAVDAAGNESLTQEVEVEIEAPPNPPAPDENGIRLTYTYDPDTFEITLHWLASS